MKTGKVKNVATFEKLVGICNDLGASYDPSKAAITPTALVTLLEQAQQSLKAVNVARATYVLAVNARKERYAGLHSLATRVVRALTASESSIENIYDARLIRRKLVSQPSVKSKGVSTAGEAGSEPKVSRRQSHLDYDGQANTFATLIELVQGIPSYKPNEADLKLETLKAVLADLQNKSQAVTTAARALANARIQRDKVLEGKDGMVEISTAVKEYIRSVFGLNSGTSKELGKLDLAA